MNREEKSATIQEIAAQIEGAEAIFAVDYRGISVPQAAELRGKLRETDSSFRVVKNRLTKLAADAGGGGAARRSARRPDRADLRPRRHRRRRESDHHLQQTAPGPDLQGRPDGRNRRSTRTGFNSIAKLPSREVLIGQFAGMVASPLTGIVRGLERADPGPRHAARPDRRQRPRDRRGSGRRARGSAEEPAPAEAEAPAEEAPAAEETPAAEAEAPADDARPPTTLRPRSRPPRPRLPPRTRPPPRAQLIQTLPKTQTTKRGKTKMATSTADWIEELKGISVLELSERIKALEEEFGVSATAVAAAAPAAAAAGGDEGGGR